MEITNQTHQKVWERQKGMCGLCGKKFDAIEENIKLIFHEMNNDSSTDNTILLCELCNTPVKKTENRYKKYSFPYANFENYSYENIIEDLQTDRDELLENMKSEENFRNIIVTINEFKQKIGSLNIERDDYIPLIEPINDLFEDAKQKQQEYNEKNKESYLENYNKLKDLVTSAIDYSSDQDNLKDAREKLIEAQNELSSSKINREHRSEILSMLNEAFEDLNKRQAMDRESYEMECIENYHRLKSIIDDSLNKISTMENLRDARQLLIDTQANFKGLILKKEQREEQYKRIQEAFEVLNKKQDEEREIFEKEAAENFENMKPKVEQIINNVNLASIFKDARQMLIDLQKELKELKLKREHRDELFGAVRIAFEELNKRQDNEREQFEAESEENYKQISAKVEQACEFSKTCEIFKEAREKFIALQNEIKDLVMKRELKDELFATIRDSFEELNKRQDSEREQFEKEAEENYIALKKNVLGACEFADNAERYKEARELLISTQSTIKTMKLKKKHADELFAMIRKSFTDLNQRQDQDRAVFEKEAEENYPLILDKVQQACEDAENLDDFRSIRDNLIALQNEIKIIKLKKEQKNDLFEKIRDAFSKFDVRQGDWREGMTQERQEKLVFILSDLQGRLDRVQESLTRDKEMLASQQEKAGQSDNTNDRIQVIEKRINSKQSSVDDIEKRISDIKAELKID